jgi:hypothetical protein
MVTPQEFGSCTAKSVSLLKPYKFFHIKNIEKTGWDDQPHTFSGYEGTRMNSRDLAFFLVTHNANR